jgi:hypothetical protein
MHERALTGKLVTFFRWGEYGIWHLPRSLKISMDGRRETVYSDEAVASHVSLYRGGDDGLAYLERLDADYVWFPRQFPVVPKLEARGWVPIFTGPHSVVLRKADRIGNAVPGVESTQVPANRCFPGP